MTSSSYKKLALAGLVRDVDDDSEPRQVRRQRATGLVRPFSAPGRSQLVRCRSIARRRLLGIVKAEQHLV